VSLDLWGGNFPVRAHVVLLVIQANRIWELRVKIAITLRGQKLSLPTILISLKVNGTGGYLSVFLFISRDVLQLHLDFRQPITKRR
jgi:hypothetical protein